MVVCGSDCCLLVDGACVGVAWVVWFDFDYVYVVALIVVLWLVWFVVCCISCLCLVCDVTCLFTTGCLFAALTMFGVF